jgi:hypothetical protein
MSPRKGPLITREHADKIVAKLGADVETNRAAHDLATVYYDGIAVLAFGIRRSSNKSAGHGHLINDLGLNAFNVLQLANCPMTYEKWVEKMKEKGWITVQRTEP